jgi:hypothetical protein
MKALYSQEEFNNSKTQDRLKLQCYQCKKPFYYRKKDIIEVSNPNLNKQGKFCSRKCKTLYDGSTNKVNCKNCDTSFYKTKSELVKTPNSFCSRSCSASYNNKHKKHGTRRSKLEIWLEEQLIQLYPNLDIHFNRKDTIGSELDIYIPELNIAIELNGIFHYEPIYGVDKLQKIQENDISKTKACHDLKIDLCIIDTSQQTYVKPKTSKKYLNIITKILNKRMLIS